MIKFFNIIRRYINKKLLPNFIFFNNIDKNNISQIKNMIIWLMCTKKKKFICKICESCINFKKNINYDFYNIKNINEDISNQILEKIFFFINTKPIFSENKVIFFFINTKNTYIINFIEKNIKNKPIYIFLISNEIKIDIKNNNLLLNTRKKCISVSITVIKMMYYNLMKLSYYKMFNNLINLNKVIIVDSLIFFFKIYLKKNYLKKYKILMNEKIINRIALKDISYLIILLTKYKKILILNKNLNIFILINFILEYINY